jgi:hypothetical protein
LKRRWKSHELKIYTIAAKVPWFLPPAKLTDNGLIGQLVANDTKVSRDTLVQLFYLSWSGLIGSRYEYETTRISG